LERVLGLTKRLADALNTSAPPDVRCYFQPWPDEKHPTAFHPAALRVFRTVFKPNAVK
jgi:hypothetical protein